MKHFQKIDYCKTGWQIESTVSSTVKSVLRMQLFIYIANWENKWSNLNAFLRLKILKITRKCRRESFLLRKHFLKWYTKNISNLHFDTILSVLSIKKYQRKLYQMPHKALMQPHFNFTKVTPRKRCEVDFHDIFVHKWVCPDCNFSHVKILAP